MANKLTKFEIANKIRLFRNKLAKQKKGGSDTEDFEMELSPIANSTPLDLNAPLEHIEHPIHSLPKRVLHINPSVFDNPPISEIRHNAKLGDPASKRLLKDYYNRLAIGKYDYHKLYNTTSRQKMIERKAKRTSNQTRSKRPSNKIDSIFVKAMNNAFNKK